MMLRLFVTVVLLLFALAFAVQNSAIVEIKLLFWQVEMPRAILIFMMILVGFVMGWFTKALFRLAKAVE